MRTESSIVRMLGRGRIEVLFWRVEVRRGSEGAREGVGCAIDCTVSWGNRGADGIEKAEGFEGIERAEDDSKAGS